MKNTHNNLIVLLLVAVIILLLFVISTYMLDGNWIDESRVSEKTVPSTTQVVNRPAANNSQLARTVSYANLLAEDAEDQDTSNIVGYIANGAFAWYVPGWIVQNWTLNDSDEDIVITPKVRNSEDDFSDIILDAEISSETYNALYLYEQNIRDIKSDRSTDLLINEIVLNDHRGDRLKIIMETKTYIYHIQNRSQNRIIDTYYLDGNGRTLTVTFSAHQDIFPQFANRIRGLVEGIGELQKPQG